MKTNKYDQGKKIKNITLVPDFILGIQGRLDGKKGENSIADATVNGLKKKCAAAEKKETLLTEARCEAARNAGADALATISSYQKEVKETFFDSNTSPQSIRLNASKKANLECVKAEAERAKRNLVAVRETLIHTDTVLNERIRHIREKKFESKLAAYIKGVRRHISDYVPDLTITDDAYEIYKEKHKSGDEAIFKAVNNIIKEATPNE